MRNFTPLSAGPRTRRTDLSEERQFPRGSQLKSISAALLQKPRSPHKHGRGYWTCSWSTACDLYRQGRDRSRTGSWMDRQPLSFSHPCISDYFSSCMSWEMESGPWCRHQKHKCPQAKQNLVNLRPQQVSTSYITPRFIT